MEPHKRVELYLTGWYEVTMGLCLGCMDQRPITWHHPRGFYRCEDCIDDVMALLDESQQGA